MTHPDDFEVVPGTSEILIEIPEGEPIPAPDADVYGFEPEPKNDRVEEPDEEVEEPKE